MEPEPFFEYSNSTGAIQHCRPVHSQSALVRWFQVTQTSGPDAPTDEQLELPRLTGEPSQEQNRWPRYVRRDGSLVISPFAAAHFKPDVHSASYRCCLTNRLGSLCSRTVRSRAGKSN